jgi:hypothetical protein
MPTMPSRSLCGLLASATLLCAAGSAFAGVTIFEPLFMVTKVVGDVRIEKPNGTMDSLRKDHAYPFGSRIIVPAELTEEETKAVAAEGAKPEPPHVFVRLARDFSFRIGAGSDVRIIDESTGEGEDLQELKVFVVAEGSVDTRISAAVKKNGGTLDEKAEKNLSAIIIRTPVGECTRMAERNSVTVEKDPTQAGYYNCLFVTQSGFMEIHGPQFELDRLKRATRVRIDGNMDFTSITPESGEFTGTFEKGADNNEKVFFRTRCVGKIWRKHAEVGNRLVIAVMVSFPDGSRKNYAYLEGQTGVDATEGPTTDLSKVADGEDGGGWGDEPAADGDGWGGDTNDSESGSDDGGGDWGGDDFGGDWSF